MELPTTPEFLVGQMRVQTMREETLFYVASAPTAMASLDKELDVLRSHREGWKKLTANSKRG